MKIDVVASTRIVEEGFAGPGLHVHAELGERGEIVDRLGDGFVMVRWARSGTVAQVDTREIRELERTTGGASGDHSPRSLI